MTKSPSSKKDRENILLIFSKKVRLRSHPQYFKGPQKNQKTNAITADHRLGDLSSLVSTPDQLPAIRSDDISCSIFGSCSSLFCCWLLRDKLIYD